MCMFLRAAKKIASGVLRFFQNCIILHVKDGMPYNIIGYREFGRLRKYRVNVAQTTVFQNNTNTCSRPDDDRKQHRIKVSSIYYRYGHAFVFDD